MVLSIHSVTDAIVIGSVSGGLMGEGPGQGWCNTSYFNRFCDIQLTPLWVISLQLRMAISCKLVL